MNAELLLKITPIIISVFALAISCLSLGWNMYRDLALKARLRVKFQLSSMHHPTFEKPITNLVLEVTNFGPGKIQLQMIQLKQTSIYRRLTQKIKFNTLLYDYTNPLSGKLPSDLLEVGHKIDLLLRYDENCFLKESFTHIGISDTFSRVHWAKKRDVRRARKAYNKDFRRG